MGDLFIHWYRKYYLTSATPQTENESSPVGQMALLRPMNQSTSDLPMKPSPYCSCVHLPQQLHSGRFLQSRLADALAHPFLGQSRPLGETLSPTHVADRYLLATYNVPSRLRPKKYTRPTRETEIKPIINTINIQATRAMKMEGPRQHLTGSVLI